LEMCRQISISNVTNDLIRKDTILNIRWYPDFEDTLLRNSAVGYFTIAQTYGELTLCSCSWNQPY